MIYGPEVSKAKCKFIKSYYIHQPLYFKFNILICVLNDFLKLRQGHNFF
jgi:hypothetical protein